MAKVKQAAEVFCILANKSYGLYAGWVVPGSGVPDGEGTRRYSVREVRSVARWYGQTGGITSLAAHGLCGPNAGDSRIGAAVPDVSELGGIVNIFPMPDAARSTIEAAKQS